MNIRRYLPGQIEDNCRGKYVLVINRPRVGDRTSSHFTGEYGSFLPLIDSDDFVDITGGFFAELNPISRVYMGVSLEAGRKAIAEIDAKGNNTATLDLIFIDNLLVKPHYVDDPDRIGGEPIEFQSTKRGLV